MSSSILWSPAFRQAARPLRRFAASPPESFIPYLTPFQWRSLSTETRGAIDKAVSSNPVVLFMKGTPETPQCGFSRASIQILGLQGVDPNKFSAFNVLEDDLIRAGIKEYSDWPTIPQLYVNKEFVGGCDILMSMHQNGELAKLFEEKELLVAAEDIPIQSFQLVTNIAEQPLASSVVCRMGKTKNEAKYDRRGILKPARIPEFEKPSESAKKVASTSRIFKNTKHHASHKPKHDEVTLKTRKPLQEKRLLSKHRYKLVPEHPLATKFNTIEDSRESIHEDLTKSVKATADHLSTRLHQIQADLSQQQEAEDEAAKAFFKPLGDEQLSFSRKDGSQAGSASLAKRMREFQKTIATEEKELGSLFQQLAEVDQKIAAEAEAALGPDWASLVAGFGKTSGKAHAGQTGSAEDLEKTTSYFEDLIDKAGQKALDEVKASEKAFKSRQANDRQKIMTLASMGDDYD